MINRLNAIKIIHTAILVFYNVVLFYMAYAVIINKIDILVWMGVGCIAIEGIVLLIFKMACPLTILARGYSNSKRHNFDIYIPEWLAKYNKQIYTTLFLVIFSGVLYRVLKF